MRTKILHVVAATLGTVFGGFALGVGLSALPGPHGWIVISVGLTQAVLGVSLAARRLP